MSLTTVESLLPEYLDRLPHYRFDLTARGPESCTRPELVLWPVADTDHPQGAVTIEVGALLGQQCRFVDLTPIEARALGKRLVDLANFIEAASHFTTLTEE